MSRRKLVSFLLLLAVAIAVTSVSPVAPETEVGPTLGYNGPLSDCDPENDAADYMDEAQENEGSLECEEDPEAEMAPDNTNWPLTGVDPRTDAAYESEEALENDEVSATDDDLETGFYSKNEDNHQVHFHSHGFRLITGYPTKVLKCPYLVGIWYQNKHICSGAIISEHWVLTAAHCFEFISKKPSQYTVTAAGDSKYMAWRYNVSSIHIHPEFERGNKEYDAALVYVDTPFYFDGYENRVGLTQDPYPRLNSAAQVCGWGTLSTDPKHPDNLDSVGVTTYSLSTCQKRTGVTFSDMMICAGNRDGSLERGTCAGDSGGPLVSNNMLVGIDTQYKSKKKCSEAPTIYTNVYYLRSWIKSVTGLKI